MQKSSLEKWVDELQAQIDAVKREVASIPAPTPVTDPDCFVFSCGAATMTVTDVPVEEGNDEEFVRFAEYEFSETFDNDNYDYYISFDYDSIDLSTALRYYGNANCMILHDSTPFQSDVLPILSSATPQDVEICEVAGVVKVDFQYGETVTLGIVSEYGDGKCIADDTGDTKLDYMIIAKKKAETRTKKKTKKK